VRKTVHHPDQQTKVCSNCRTEKEASRFHCNRRTADGLSSWCKQCNRLANQRYRNDERNQLKLSVKKLLRKLVHGRKRSREKRLQDLRYLARLVNEAIERVQEQN